MVVGLFVERNDPAYEWCSVCKSEYQTGGEDRLGCPSCWPADYTNQASVNRALVRLGHAQVTRLDSIRTATLWIAVIVAAFALLTLLGIVVLVTGS